MTLGTLGFGCCPRLRSGSTAGHPNPCLDYHTHLLPYHSFSSRGPSAPTSLEAKSFQIQPVSHPLLTPHHPQGPVPWGLVPHPPGPRPAALLLHPVLPGKCVLHAPCPLAGLFMPFVQRAPASDSYLILPLVFQGPKCPRSMRLLGPLPE